VLVETAFSLRRPFTTAAAH